MRYIHISKDLKTSNRQNEQKTTKKTNLFNYFYSYFLINLNLEKSRFNVGNGQGEPINIESLSVTDIVF